MDEVALKSFSDFVKTKSWRKETDECSGKVICATLVVLDDVFPRQKFNTEESYCEAYFDGEVGEDRHRVIRKRIKEPSPAIESFRAAARQMLMKDFKSKRDLIRKRKACLPWRCRVSPMARRARG
jgi:hypothetical protein